jgi:vacuolar protein sorting-associated protein 45
VRPNIRFAHSSPLAKQLASDLQRRIGENEQLFHFPQQQQDAVLLVLDRKDDPVTPLVQNWGYQALVHEQFGIEANRVDLSAVPGIKPEMREVVLSTNQDAFYRKSAHMNFGELGQAVNALVSDYQAKSAVSGQLDTIADMQRFVDKYPEIKQMAGSVAKHLSLLSELSRLIKQHGLLEVSEIEQDLACPGGGVSHVQAIEQLTQVLDNPRVRFSNKLNLVLLYALRYEADRNNYTEQFKQKLSHIAPDVQSRSRLRAVDELLKHCGQAKRGTDLYGTGSVWTKTVNLVNSLKDVENAFTRHKPHLLDTLELIFKGKLKNKDYPLADAPSADEGRIPKPTAVYVYMLGGLTYEENSAVYHGIVNNREYNGQVFLGSNTVHNSTSFINDLLQNDGIQTPNEITIDMLQ